MPNCHVTGCRHLETRCKDCGRLVADRILPPPCTHEHIGDANKMIEDPEMSFHNDSPASFLFCLKEAKTDWVMKITKNGVEFNREGFPDWTPDDFANNVMDILEKSLRLKGTAIPKLVELDINMNKE